ncbi:hypothetical protein CHO01_28670 [Cellulomonas hominis]|uniref:Uncharacterized protein n=1 Tax=Cellulomonas hominis TaxID=156981 RepID=A0A511FET8_9CELL|nr:hypothetical protein [Cellulomonas hominis]MBB5473902.1 hypothetical protein [Cellulomonas hominis]GEL47751.1 hypothetical protein CHO01_28670 [Cellulomonas hominis]
MPLGSALVLAVATGSLLLVARLRDQPVGGRVGLVPMAAALAATVAVSAALTATASRPAGRSRISPEQLRSE